MNYTTNHHFEHLYNPKLLTKNDIKKTLLAIEWCLDTNRIYDVNTLLKSLDKKIKKLNEQHANS